MLPSGGSGFLQITGKLIALGIQAQGLGQGPWMDTLWLTHRLLHTGHMLQRDYQGYMTDGADVTDLSKRKYW